MSVDLAREPKAEREKYIEEHHGVLLDEVTLATPADGGEPAQNVGLHVLVAIVVVIIGVVILGAFAFELRPFIFH